MIDISECLDNFTFKNNTNFDEVIEYINLYLKINPDYINHNTIIEFHPNNCLDTVCLKFKKDTRVCNIITDNEIINIRNLKFLNKNDTLIMDISFC